MSFLISTAYAADAATTASASTSQNPVMSTIFMLVIFGVFIYFLLWRPQNKRAKSHQGLITSLKAGDEVVTTGGIHGKIIKIDETSLMLKIAENTEIRLHKSSIASTLPKGTLKFN